MDEGRVLCVVGNYGRVVARAGFVNGVAGGFTADVLISSAVFWIYLFSRNTSQIWMYIALNLLIGLSCALPLYLWRQAVLAEASAHQRPAK